MNGQAHYIPAEPCSVGADTIANLLRRIGWQSSAEFVEQLNRKEKADYRQAEVWRQRYLEIADRYCPQPAANTTNYKPGPECDG